MLRTPGDEGADATLPVVSEGVREALLVNIRRRMTPQPLKIRADVELTCFAYDGVLHIKAAMRAAQAVSTPDCKVQMKLVAPPLYVLTTQTLEKEAGIALLLAATAACGASIEGAKGKLVVKEGARAVSERDEKLLAEKLEKLQQQNEEVAGDDEDEEDETMGDAECVRQRPSHAQQPGRGPRRRRRRPAPDRRSGAHAHSLSRARRTASTRRPCPQARQYPRQRRPRPRRLLGHERWPEGWGGRLPARLGRRAPVRLR